MKNIHLLPTDKPSRLSIGNNKNFVFGILRTAVESYNNDFTNQHIYITSDEKFKQDEYITDGIEVIKASPKLVNAQGLVDRRNWKKIILTTDQDLIKDGVQAIDDEFLEWFVQNPSCEFVEVIYEPKNFLDTKQGWEYEIIIPKKNFYCGDKFDYDEQCEFQCDTCVDKKGVDYGYLPKEEPKKVLTEEDIFNQKDIDAVTDYINKEQQKQHLIDMMKSDEELGLYGEVYSKQGIALTSDYIQNIEKEIKLEEVFNDEKKENLKKFIDEIKNPSEPNQALKDAAQRYEKYSERFDNKVVEGIFNPDNWGRRLVKEEPKQETLEEAAELFFRKKDDKNCTLYKAAKFGAKWQQERMYSEEDLIAFGEFIFKHTLLAHAKGVKNLFEQFKKK
jgi:hypothetical protein